MKKSRSFYFFRRKPVRPAGDKYDRWRKVVQLAHLSPEAGLRLEWMIFYYKVSGQKATLTCKHFGISRKTFYKWLNRFQGSLEDVWALKERSRAPIGKRQWEVSPMEEVRIIKLRKEHMHYGKKKLKVLYRRKYGEEISCWKIERVIRRHKLFPDKAKAQRVARKVARAKEHPRKRITGLVKEKRLWFLLQLDTVTLYGANLKRYILTALDHASKLGYARMYGTKSSGSAADFLYRLQYLIHQPLRNLQTDSGSEFAHYFERASVQLGIERYFSRVKTPKDNPEVERFNETLKYEWLYDGHLSMDCDEFNPDLTDWLIEYNFYRPHQSLDYLAPMEWIQKELEKSRKVLPMSSATTRN